MLMITGCMSRMYMIQGRSNVVKSNDQLCCLDEPYTNGRVYGNLTGETFQGYVGQFL